MQGFNMGRYHPPSTLDASLSTHSSSRLSNRAPPKSKTAPTAPTVRFEMPFAIWCTTCPSPSTTSLIGQGVRFNALKKRVGNYYSTPIWSFRMKHTACSGWLEIRTDPKNSDFVVTEGARKRDYGVDGADGEESLVASRVKPGDGVGGVDEERERRRQDAFAAFEGKAAEKVRKVSEAERVEELRAARERDWRDVDAAGARVRKGFRVGRKERSKAASVKEEVKDRMGLGIELLDVSEADARRAQLVDFGPAAETGGSASGARRPFLSTNNDGQSSEIGKPVRKGAPTSTDILREELSGNTRAALDPFATHSGRRPRSGGHPPVPKVKRKREISPPRKVDLLVKQETDPPDQPGGALVEYDSD